MSNLRDNARDLRKHMTDAERRLWSRLRGEQLGARFRRQAPIGPYIADFACFEPRLVIEVDGGQHDEQRDYDGRRDGWLNSQGFRVLHFWNNEVLENTDGVLECILSELKVLGCPHPNPPPQGGREKKDVASCDVGSEVPHPKASEQGARARDDLAANRYPALSPWMVEGWGGGEASPPISEVSPPTPALLH